MTAIGRERWVPLFVIGVGVGLFCLLVPLTPYTHQQRRTLILSAGYFLCMSACVFTPIAFTGIHIYHIAPGPGRINLMLFNDTSFKDLWQNILLTVPAGLLMPLLMPRLHHWVYWAIAPLVGLFNECGQLVLNHYFAMNRTFDVNDIVTNTLGVLLGYAVLKGLLQFHGIHQWLAVHSLTRREKC
ncbi:VanZ family protein [Lactobacillus selangorensis]|nr:VanZ family protein [Lactobacillus selangorensis]